MTCLTGEERLKKNDLIIAKCVRHFSANLEIYLVSSLVRRQPRRLCRNGNGRTVFASATLDRVTTSSISIGKHVEENDNSGRRKQEEQ